MNTYAYLDEDNICCRVDHSEQDITCSEKIIKISTRGDAPLAVNADSADEPTRIITNPFGMRYVNGVWEPVEQPITLPETTEELIARMLANFSVIKSIQRGISTVPGDGTTRTITINKVNLKKAFFDADGNGRNGTTGVGAYSYASNVYIKEYSETSFTVASAIGQAVPTQGHFSWQVIEFI